MDTATQILVIIVSSFLAIFLIVGILATIKLVQLLKTIKRIVDKAEKVAGSAEAVGDFFRKTAGPMALLKIVANMAESVSKHSSKRK